MKALMAGVPFRAIETTETTAVEGTPFALPFRTYPHLSFLVFHDGAVSAFEYDVYASTDGGTTWTLVGDGLNSQQDFVDLAPSLTFPLLRIDQVSRTNGDGQAVDVTLGQS